MAAIRHSGTDADVTARAEYEWVKVTLRDPTTVVSERLRMNPVSLPDDPLVILVVDDDELTRQLLRRIMEKEGYKVFEAVNGEQGLEAYQRLKPHLVLLDAIMPVMDGFTCCTQLQLLCDETQADNNGFADNKHLRGLARTPVLMITGLDDPESVDRAFAAGATDYIRKPIHVPVLRQRVRRLIQQSQLYKQLQVANRELQRLATLDGLTGVANRRRFDQYLDDEWQQMTRENLPLSLILCDIDFFKRYNDTYGHQAGDDCLRRVADALRFCAKRSIDLVARYGGEEFAVILPNTTTAGAVQVAEEIRLVVNSLNIPHKRSDVSPHLTLSLGIACAEPTPQLSPSTLIAAADAALYKAKAAGRDTTFPKICDDRDH